MISAPIPVQLRTQDPGKLNILGLDRAGLENFFTDLGEKPFRASQMLKWLYQQRVSGFGDMTNISLALRDRLAEIAEIRLPEIVTEAFSDDGTIKWALRLDSDNLVEMVFIPEDERGTLCVSSQVGCALDCQFCSTARQGFNRNLTVAEIIGQLRLAVERMPEGRSITNIVLMGMGEPLLNFSNVVSAVNLMKDDLAFGLARKRITISTAGVVPAIDRLSEVSDVALAVSLHAPNDDLRDSLVPLNRKYPIRELLDACKRYARKSNPGGKITFEYVMLDGVNDSPQHARELLRILGRVPSKINLIPFNPFPQTEFRTSPPEVIDRFRMILKDAGLMTITRKTRGDDIDAACGQLVGQVKDKSRRHRRFPQVPQ